MPESEGGTTYESSGWTNPENALACDDTGATRTLGSFAELGGLAVYGWRIFGAIPSNAVINSITFTSRAKASTSGDVSISSCNIKSGGSTVASTVVGDSLNTSYANISCGGAGWSSTVTRAQAGVMGLEPVFSNDSGSPVDIDLDCINNLDVRWNVMRTRDRCTRRRH